MREKLPGVGMRIFDEGGRELFEPAEGVLCVEGNGGCL
jgi:hypothetical protein